MIRMRLSGFTVIELIVVIGILGVLTAIGLTSYSGSKIRARDVIRKQDANNVALAMNLYRKDNGRYPLDSDNAYAICNNSNQASDITLNSNWSEINSSISSYLIALPLDPIGKCLANSYPYSVAQNKTKGYAYTTKQYLSPNTPRFAFWVALENTKDAQRSELGLYTNLLDNKQFITNNSGLGFWGQYLYGTGCKLKDTDPNVQSTTPCYAN